MRLLMILSLLVFFLIPSYSQEIVYAEMEFPLGFVSHLREYRFDPLAKFQTEVEGRILELTCDPLIDIYEVRSGQLAYRPCLATWQNVDLGSKTVLNFNLADIAWPSGRAVGYEDILFGLTYKKLNKNSWSVNPSIALSHKGTKSIDALREDANDAPKLGEFYFPVVNKDCFEKAETPAEAFVNKTKQKEIGYGRYQIQSVDENRSLLLQRNPAHPYFQNLTLPTGQQRIESIRMQSFPKAVIARNEQFIAGRVHLLTSVTQADRGYIQHSFPDAKVSAYSDDSFSGFVFNCYNPYLKFPVVRRALNYIFRKNLVLQKALGGEGEIISGPLPRRNFFYNLTVPPYEDDVQKAFAVLQLFCRWGLDAYEKGGKVYVSSVLKPSPAADFSSGDQIVSVERKEIGSVEALAAALSLQDNVFRVQIVRGKRLLVLRIQASMKPPAGILKTVAFGQKRLSGFPAFSLIANNPEGKNPLVKEICGALKEDFERVGIGLKIDYLDGKDYYTRLRQGKFDLAYRTVKITGTPNLHRMFYKGNTEDAENTNYGSYSNEKINELASAGQNITDVSLLKNAWKMAHEILHHDPPYLYLWSRRHIIMYNPKIQILTPGPEYSVPFGYTNINGLINIFNEVHLWTWKEGK